MAKVKIFLLISIAILLTIFISENTVIAPPIKLFGQQLFQVHTSIIIVSSFVIGLICGWLGHFSWSRSRRKTAELASSEQKVPEPQEQKQQEENKQ